MGVPSPLMPSIVVPIAGPRDEPDVPVCAREGCRVSTWIHGVASRDAAVGAAGGRKIYWRWIVNQVEIRSRSVVRAVTLIGLVTVLAVAASAQVAAPPPDEPAIYISSNFVQDDGPVKVVQDLTIDVAGVSITAATGRIRGIEQITLQNATITINEAVATHVRSRMIYRREQLRDVPSAK